jgi:hypothetical protein
MKDSENSSSRSFTAFRSAAEEADTKRKADAMKREEQSWDNEGGHVKPLRQPTRPSSENRAATD